MSDYIKREDAIEQARRNWLGEGELVASTEIQLLNNLPTADVRENVRGEWIIIKDQEWSGGEYVKCSNCDYGYAIGAYHEPAEFKYCPNCGADMRSRIGEGS